MQLGGGMSLGGGGGGGSGTVTSISLSAPAELTVSGSPVTTSGTLTLTNPFHNAKKFWPGPTTGADAAPSFRSLVAADIPTLNQNTSGTAAGLSVTLAPTSGGTGLATATQGDLLYASAANTYSALVKNTSATRYLSNTGSSNNPAWAQINLANGVTGVLSFANFTNASGASKLFGRGDSGAGVFQEITLGTNLSISGTTLNATGGGGSQTPWASDINGGGFSLSNVNAITATSFAGDGSALTGVTATSVPGGTAGQIQYNVSGTSTGGDIVTTDGAANWIMGPGVAASIAIGGTVGTLSLGGGPTTIVAQANGNLAITSPGVVSLYAADASTQITLRGFLAFSSGTGPIIRNSGISMGATNFNMEAGSLSMNVGGGTGGGTLSMDGGSLTYIGGLSAVASAISAVDPTTTAIGTLLTTVTNYIGSGNALLTDSPEWLIITTPSGATRKIPVYAP